MFFSVHKKLICSASAFFDKAFNGSFAGAMDGRMDLEENNPEIVAGFVQWLYTKHCLMDLPNDIDGFVATYIFADKIHCNALKNHAMDRIQDMIYDYDYYLTTRNFREIFAKTLNSSNAPLRKFCAATLSYELLLVISSHKNIQQVFKEVPDIVSEYFKFESTRISDFIDVEDDPRVRQMHSGFSLCFFHVHEEGEVCTLKPNYLEETQENED